MLLLLEFDFLKVIHREFPNSRTRLYNSCIYFAVTTLTTVGFGDIYPLFPLQKVWTVLLEFFGIVLYGFAMLKVGSIIDSTQIENTAKEERVRTV